MAMKSTSGWVFSFSLLSFLFDSTPQISLGEEKWIAVAREIGIYYQLKREHHTPCQSFNSLKMFFLKKKKLALNTEGNVSFTNVEILCP